MIANYRSSRAQPYRQTLGPKYLAPATSHIATYNDQTTLAQSAMVLRIRLSRFGKKHAPFYNIVLTHARTARNSRPLEVLGTYNPIPQPPRPGDTHGRPWKDIKLDVSRARYWVGVGAQPSDTAWRLLSMVGLLVLLLKGLGVEESKRWTRDNETRVGEYGIEWCRRRAKHGAIV